jgi:formate hydrogenlyase subunit 3/multisubunit Na+/H+ antiporter MnhD subunit
MTQGRKIRVFQIICIAFALFCFFIIHDLPAVSNSSAMTALQWIAIFGALYSAVMGFNMQKRILRVPRNQRTTVKSTPVSRWMAVNVLRLGFAISVCCWAMVLHFNGGPEWLASSMNGLGVLLLLVLRPGQVPASEP